jgi:serine/threonine protein phosphatase 1
MGNTYVIADLHGRFDLLEMALEAIEKHAWACEVPPKIITLGDYIDRGPQSRQIIERLMADQQDSAGAMICLKGNHEDIMWQTCRKLPHTDWWISNGGGATLISYGHPTTGCVDIKCIPDDHLHWAWSLPFYYEDTHRFYVHAGIRRDWPFAKQMEGSEPSMLWFLYADNDDFGCNGKHVVHGHHQHANGPLLKKHRTDLDTFAWYTGRLVVGVFDDNIPGGPVDLIEIKGASGATYLRYLAEQMLS